MKTIMKKVLSVLMVLAILLVPMAVMAEDAELGSYANPHQLSTTSERFYVAVEPGVDAYIQVDDSNNSTVVVGYATGDYMLMYGRQAVYNNADDNKTASLTIMSYSDIFGVCNLTEETIYVYMSLTAGVAVEEQAGTMDNPEKVEIVKNFWGGYGANVETQLDAGNEGYYYSVTAPGDGVITVGVNAMDADYNYIGWLYCVNNITSYKYGEYRCSVDEVPVYYEKWAVSEGDELVVFAATYDPDNMWNNPAGTVLVDFSFAAKGSYSYPEVIETTGAQSATVEASSQGYYYEWTAPSYGKVSISMDDESGWQYQVSKAPVDESDWTSYYNGDLHTYVGEEAATAYTYSVAAASETATSATITFDNTEKRTVGTTEQQIWEENGITVTNNKGSGNNVNTDFYNPVRFYKNSGVIIEYTEAMTQIVITANSAAYATSLSKSLASTDADVTVNASVVTIVPTTPATSFSFTCSDAQVRVDSVTVYTGDAQIEPEEPAYDPTGKTAAEIVDAAYELEEGKEFATATTLTGVITAVDYVYNEQYQNVTVTIAVDGADPEKTIQCFRLKGDGADVIAVGDTITVTGNIKNYKGTIEFDAGCTLDSYEKAVVANVVSSEELIVYAGETVTVMVNTYDPENEWSAPAGTVNWSFNFEPIAAFVPVDTDAYIGNEFDVVINLENNPGIISLKLDVNYDSNVLELVGVKDGVLTGSTESDGETLGCYTYSETYDANPYTINWIDALSTENITTSGAVAILTFKVKDTAELGETTISVSYDPDSVFDKDFNNVAIEIMEGTVSIVHKLVTVPEVAATCTESGVAEHEKCEICGTLFRWGMEVTEEDLVIDPQHSYDYIDATEPTCTENGMETHFECSLCGVLAIYSYDVWDYVEVAAEDIAIASLGHILVKIEKVEATTEATGMEEHYKCSVCDALFADEAGETPVTEEELVIDKLASHTPGDINGDGAVNNKDLGLLMQFNNDWNVTIVEAAADVNADGAINNKDYGLLMQYLNDWDVVLK